MTTLIVVVLLGVVIAWAGCITASSGRTHLRRPELAWLRGGAVVTLSVPVALHLHALTAVWYVSTTTYDDASHGQTVVTVGSSSGMAQLMTLAVVASGVLSALSVYGRRDWSALGLACACCCWRSRGSSRRSAGTRARVTSATGWSSRRAQSRS